MFVALLALCAGLWFSNPDFVGQSNVVNTTKQVAMLGIMAIGTGFVIITGGIDLSVGSIVGLTGVLIARFSGPKDVGGNGWPILVGIALAMLIVLLIGWIQGVLITRLNLQPFIVTLGGMLLLRGVSQTVVKGASLSFGDSPFRNFADTGWLNFRGDALLPYPVVMFLIVIAVSAYVLHFTVFGRYVYAIGGNRDAAEYSGINVKRVETSTYVISAGLAGLSGVCYAAYIGQMSQQVGIAYELYAITAAVLGGCSLRGGEGTVVGIVIGTFVMKVIEDGFDMFQWRYTNNLGQPDVWRLDTNWKNIVIGMTILVAVIIDQLTHIVQARRRTRRAGEIVAARAQGFDVIPAGVNKV
jgi:ribose transport system permease protein